MKSTLTLGVDIGGTNVKMALVDARGRVVAQQQVPTPARVTPQQMVALVARATAPWRRQRRVGGVGIGVPGLVDVERGVIHTLVNIRGWRQVPLRRLMRAAFGVPAAVDNDVNLMALAEARFGAGRGARVLLCVALGTGVGGALVFDGRLYRGVTLSAGEIGHVPITRDGERCGCGGRGCLETYVGNRRIAARARALLRRNSPSLLRSCGAAKKSAWCRFPTERQPLRQRRGARLMGAGTVLTPEALSRAASRGDRLAQAVWRDVAEDLGVALVGAVNLLNPDRIIIGGGVAQAGRWLFAPLRRVVRERAMAVPARAAKIVPAALGPAAGVIGAATLVRELLGGETTD